MTRVTETDLFGFNSTATTSFGLSPTTLNMVANTSGRLTKEEREILHERDKQLLVVDAQADKSLFAMNRLGEVDQYAFLQAAETFEYALELKAEVKGEEAQLYMTEFVKRGLQMYGRQMLGCIEVSGANIGAEVHRSLYPPEPEQKPEPPQRGVLSRLLFG